MTATVPIKSQSLETVSSTSPTLAILGGHFLLRRPIAPPGNDWIEASYRYGSTQKGTREIHHGVEMKNLLGTPVLAAADGTVVVAGNDQEVAYGPKTNFYGQLVILKHDFPELGQPLYTLYAHLSQVSVKVGEIVRTGQILGQVGMTGWAIGYHLHFEVRLGKNGYENTRNPELWLQPPSDKTGQPTSALAGHIVNRNGQPLRVAKVVLTSEVAPFNENRIFVETYDDQSMARTDLTIQEPPEDYALVPYTHQTLGRDDLWCEDFAISNLPAGKYLFSFTVKKVYTLEVEIRPGQLTFITFPLDRE
ncbi:MAG: M23 family metallopeptidase [Anaerolineales bacterium]|nr:M23 family metallopeptidase [Anaerolineales bacterium]